MNQRPPLPIPPKQARKKLREQALAYFAGVADEERDVFRLTGQTPKGRTALEVRDALGVDSVGQVAGLLARMHLDGVLERRAELRAVRYLLATKSPSK